jgi:hypothetical protein
MAASKAQFPLAAFSFPGERLMPCFLPLAQLSLAHFDQNLETLEMWVILEEVSTMIFSCHF